MSLLEYDIFVKDSYSSIVSPLGETMPKIESQLMYTPPEIKQYLIYTDCSDTYSMLYHKFNNYAMELTISPKSSPRLKKVACECCGSTSLLDVHTQYDIMMQLINHLVEKFKINVLGTCELYKDKKNVHAHIIINNQNENKKKRIVKFIKEYYGLGGPLVNLKPIVSREKFLAYLIKDPFGEYFYYDERNEKELKDLEDDGLEWARRQSERRAKKCKCILHECAYCLKRQEMFNEL